MTGNLDIFKYNTSQKLLLNFTVESMPSSETTEAVSSTTTVTDLIVSDSSVHEGAVSPETIVVITSIILAVCLAVSILVLAWAIVRRKRLVV